ncbi:hypothetical protein FIBSPDRAFT_1046896 [Athelia psychrophila]|uniref:Uncharacterized protein n=1 Tax=Athelia psychrophila TaxID=1759441 RepID=A0A166G1N8_9AGAM|nr:hypothetical protein FIBSPDRAFT_1046896 [Fibularhizoctonia sp. CBS 109695]
MAPLSPQGKRIRTIMVALPIMAATSFVMYKRLVLGEEQRLLPREGPATKQHILETPRERMAERMAGEKESSQ